MSAVVTLLAIEAAIALVAWLFAGRRIAQWLVLLAVTAPLEVYRTPLAGLNLSLFRLSLIIAGVGLLISSSAQVVRTLRSRLVQICLATGFAVGLSLLTLSSNTDAGGRLLAVIAIGVAAVAVTATLAAQTGFERTLRAIVLGGVLPIVAACWQAISISAGWAASLPLLESSAGGSRSRSH